MTKAAILRCIEDMESRLEELRAAVEELPEAAEPRPAATLVNIEQEETEGSTNDLSMVFATLRTAWNVLLDEESDLPLEELQQAMAGDLPENWASRELMRMREE
jgi:hypothetical protein